MSHHLAGITARNCPQINVTDVYVFKGRHGPVFTLNTNALSSDTGWHQEAIYEIHIDTDGDFCPDMTLRATFEGDGADGATQTASLYLHTGFGCNRDALGLLIARTETSETAAEFGGGVKFFAGRRGEPFYIDGAAVTAVREAVTTGSELDLSKFDPGRATNLFRDSNVHSIVVEIPETLFKALTACAREINFWGAVSVPNEHRAGYRQVDRAATPLAATLFGFDVGDAYNATAPADDEAEWGDQIRAMITAAVIANGYEGDAEAYAAEAAHVTTPDVLPYKIGTAADFTVQNGRGLTENTPEQMFSLVLGGMRVDMGLGPENATGTIKRRFPYLADPIDNGSSRTQP